DNAGVGTVPDTENDPSRAASRSETDRRLQLGRQAVRVEGPRRAAGRDVDVVRVGEEEIAARPVCPADPGIGTELARGVVVLGEGVDLEVGIRWTYRDRKSTRLNSSHQIISYAVFCLKKKNIA